MMNSRKLNIFEKIVLLLYELNKKMKNESYITYAIAAQISLPIGLLAYTIFAYLIYDILSIFNVNTIDDKVTLGLDIAAILFSLSFIYIFEKRVNKIINVASEKGYINDMPDFNEKYPHLYDKSILNYCTRCNRLEGKFKNGLCRKCGSKLTSIE